MDHLQDLIVHSHQFWMSHVLLETASLPMFASVLIWQPFSIFGVEFRFVELERRIMIRRWRRFFRVRLRTIRGACDRRARVAPEKRISANPGQNFFVSMSRRR